MVSTAFFALLTAVPLLHMLSLRSVLPLVLMLSYACLFASYQQHRPEEKLFHAFLLLGISSLLLPQVLWLSPLLLFCCMLYLRSLTLGSLLASILGLLVPIAGLALWGLIQWDFTLITEGFSNASRALTHIDLSYWQMLYTTTPASLPPFEWQFLVSTIGVLLLSVIAIVNQRQTSYLDNIRVRMFYYVMDLTQIGLALLLIFFPEERWTWLLLLIANGAPLIAHYLTLTRGWLSATIFWLSLILLPLLIFFNYQTEWIVSLIFS